MFDTKDHSFHNAETAAKDGAFFENREGFKYLTVDIDGDPTSFTLNFEQSSINGARRSLKGINVADWSTGITTSTSHQTWQFDISGIKRVYMDLAAITQGEGSLTVKGTAGY